MNWRQNMKTINLEQIMQLNKLQKSKGTVITGGNCSWRYNIHAPAKKSVYEKQNAQVRDN